MPSFSKVDHIHVYVTDRLTTESWYHDVLGFTRIPQLEVWFNEGGPLTLVNGGVHIALFDHPTKRGATIAFSTDAENYLKWKTQLNKHNVEFKEYDHDLSWSFYFSDPDGNPYEITSFDYEDIAITNLN
ncbi:VOC family protein [Shewanella sp. 202IG2-18]|uniref:VOC family protein n=1 Tax=Parashewanella hymeniacidonis TaxID=2807618 RepID=UPI001960B6E8|nr:VOC family protein [Parashewanella hymeniacidonis]MBM7073033.1 VOC family protein [Parashewanella hymeniacidonis]